MHEGALVVMRDEKVEKKNTAWSVSNSTDDLDEVFDLSDDMEGQTSNFTPKVTNPAPETVHPPANLNAPNFSHPPNQCLVFQEKTLRSTPRQPSVGTENRYTTSEPRNQFPQKPIDYQGSCMRVSRSEPRFPNLRRQPPPLNMNAPPSMGEKKPTGIEASAFRNSKLPSNMPKQEPPRPGVPNTQASGYGIFSNSTANAPTRHGVAADDHRNKVGILNPATSGAGPNQNIPCLKSDGS